MKKINQLRKYTPNLPEPDSLGVICRQGPISGALHKGYAITTEGSEWIVKCSRKTGERPLGIFVWGELED